MLHRYNKTAGAKRGLVETSAYEALLPYVAKPDEPPRYALHFGTVNKVGVNPRSEWDTPLAVCAFPLTEEIFKQFLKIKLPFAQKDSKYLYLLEIRPEARVFYSTPRFFNQGIGPEYVSNPKNSEKFFYSTRPEDYKNSPKYFSEEHQTVARSAQWGRSLMEMGIDVWVDADNEGILHENEPSQVMFFNPRSYSIVLSMDNPKKSLEVRFGRDWRKRNDARDIDLRGMDLRDIDPRHIDLRHTDLTGANLEGVILHKADLTGAVLTGAILTGAILDGANLTEANLTEANLEDVNLTGAYLQYVKYDATTIWPEDVRDVLRVWRGDKDLQGADLRGADLRGADLTGADLTEAKLRKAKLINAILTGADLTNADLRGANLTGADLTGADLSGAFLPYAILTDANLSGADLIEAFLHKVDLTGITYDDETTWPEGFTPPPSTPRPNRRR